MPQFDVSAMQSAEGYTTVRWSWPSEAPEDLFQLRLVEPDTERIAYEGPNHQVFLSGLPEGDYTMRVRHRFGPEAEWGEWSDPASLAVRHHSMKVAFTLFTLGGLMVAWIVVFLVRNVAATERTPA